MPSSNGRLAIAFLVVAAGAALAWTFRQPEASRETDETETAGIVYRQSPPPVAYSQARPISAANLSVGNSSSQAQESTPTDDAPAVNERQRRNVIMHDGLANIVPRDPPSNDARSSGQPIHHTARRVPISDSGPVSNGDDGPRLSPVPPTPNLNIDRGGMRKHKIADGDSLETLALRYLGDAGRSAEIYELNRDLLPAVDVLPIGVTVVIPR